MPVAIDRLIPHRAPMQWIDALIECTDTAAAASACFDAEHFAVADGSVLETALVECVAQTVAAAQAHRAQTRGQSDQADQGMLLAVSGFRLQSRPPVGKPMQIEVRELRRLGPMLAVSGVVSCAGQPIASGELTLYA